MADLLSNISGALNSIYYSLPPLLPKTKEIETVIIREVAMFRIPQGSRTFIRIAGLSGAIAVALGAYGSHGMYCLSLCVLDIIMIVWNTGWHKEPF